MKYSVLRDVTAAKEQQPCCCPQLILRELNSILVETFCFVLLEKDMFIDHASKNTRYNQPLESQIAVQF